MNISAQTKNVLVTISAFGWGIFFIYMLVSENFASVTRGSGKDTIMFFAGPFIFFGLGYHHWTKPRGQKGIPLLTWLYGIMGVMAVWVGVEVLTDKTSSIAYHDFLLIIFGFIHLILAYWCYQNSPDDDRMIESNKT